MAGARQVVRDFIQKHQPSLNPTMLELYAAIQNHPETTYKESWGQFSSSIIYIVLRILPQPYVRLRIQVCGVWLAQRRASVLRLSEAILPILWDGNVSSTRLFPLVPLYHSHTWSHLVTPCHTLPHLVTPCHTSSHLVTLGHTWSHPVTPSHT